MFAARSIALLSAVFLLLTACGGAGVRDQPTMLEAETTAPSKDVMACVLARATTDGYVPINGGTDDSFLELTRGRENLGTTLLTGVDASYNQGLTVIAAGGQKYRLLVYRTNSNATRNAVRYKATEAQRAYAEDIWTECTARREECLAFQSDYEACLERGGYDPLKGSGQ